MMLHGDERQAFARRPTLWPMMWTDSRDADRAPRLRGSISKVRIRCVERLAEELEAGEIFEIAQVLALVGKAAAREGKDILQMAADGQQRRRIERQRHGERHKAARAANQLRRAIDQRHHGVVAALQNFAVVHQECVGDVPEPREGFVVVDGDGLFAEVGAGHHQSLHARIGKEQMLQRRVRQKDAQPRNSRRDGLGNAAACAPPRQNNRPRESSGAAPLLRRSARRLRARHRDRAPSPRAACRSDACARAGASPRPRWSRPRQR